MTMDKTPCNTPLKSGMETITELNAPKLAKHCKQFVVVFLSLFLKNKEIIILFYELTKKKKEFS